MSDLDFAFVSLINSNQRGATFRKLFMDRLAPFLFGPCLEKVRVDLADFNLRGGKIRLPMDGASLSKLDPKKHRAIMNKSFRILKRLKWPPLAVDRRLKQQFAELPAEITAQFGDHFLKALVLVLVREHLKRNSIERIVIIGDTENLFELIAELSIYDIPLSLQGYDLLHYELLAYRLLYEKGRVISTSRLNPGNWGDKDLVIVLDGDLQQICIRYPIPVYIRLNDNDVNITPGLQNALMKSGMETRMCSLAPLMETCFLVKAGFSYFGEEQGKANNHNGKEFLHLQEIGDNLGLWHLFLDKAI